MTARGRVAQLVRRELRLAVHRRWFVAYAVILGAAGLLVGTVGGGNTDVYGYRGVAKSLIGLGQLALVTVPLMALLPAIATLADERESGALEYLLAQPVSFGETFVGKWIGCNAALGLAVAIGLGAVAAVAVVRGVPWTVAGHLTLLVLLLTWAFGSVGSALGGVCRARARATTLGLALWLVSVALGTLGAMALFVRWGVPSTWLVGWSLVNPVEAFRLGLVTVLDPDLSVLGPVGADLAASWGVRGVAVAALASLAIWCVAPGVLGWMAFRRARLG